MRSMPNEENPGQLEVLLDSMLSLLADGDTEEAKLISEEILNRSRSGPDRDHLIEARVRLERALIGLVPTDNIGSELRWCVDRLNAISRGSSLHGLALLNLATWHANRGELMMSLATHSEISLNNGHPLDIKSLSRIEVGRILSNMGDYAPAKRHLWSARSGFIESEMVPEAIAASLEWLDLALDKIDENSPTMSALLENARPREGPGNTQNPSNPGDITDVVEYLFPLLCNDLSGHSRIDLGLILEASEKLDRPIWKNALRARKEEIQDPRVLEELQS